MSGVSMRGLSVAVAAALCTGVTFAQVLDRRPLGETVERHLTGDDPLQPWTVDLEYLEAQRGDEIAMLEVETEELETVKLTDVVPPIQFASGVAQIPDSTVAEIRTVLDQMSGRRNVRLNLVGHADNQQLSPELAAIFGDNEGLSRERAGEVAELLQQTLSLPADAVSYTWAGDTQPVASNETEAGRAQNRRVEVEVWYDVVSAGIALEEVLLQQDINRIKVCRMETVCKLQYVDGHENRARVQNLIPPLRYDDAGIEVSEEFIGSVRQALANMSDKTDVVVRFIGYADATPLAGRNERIYGDHVGLSSARARRVALAVQEALGLPTVAVESDGRGTEKALGSNETPLGRALNRRVEVEFWYDDPLQQLPDEPQICPVEGDGTLVTRVYDPPWGAPAPVVFEDGSPLITDALIANLQRSLEAVSDRRNVRLRFVGYTANEGLERRTAVVYGDDIGLSSARARRTMEAVAERMALTPEQAEFEGRGFVQSDDVVNAGFIQGQTSHVVAEVLYDEIAAATNLDGVEITRLNQELAPQNPFGLNLMRITVDGEPIDDPQRSFADIQRCTDVALENTNIRFGYDNLSATPRLSVSADPPTLALVESEGELIASEPVSFAMYANYLTFIERAEIRIFESEQSLRETPVDVVPIEVGGQTQWLPESGRYLRAPTQEYKFVLRAYGDDGQFDETLAQPLWFNYQQTPRDADSTVVPETSEAAVEEQPSATPTTAASPMLEYREFDANLLEAYGDSRMGTNNIALSSGTVTVHGGGIPDDHTVWVAGQQVPVNERGEFVAETILPSGLHTVEVAVLDQQGNGELFLRDIELQSRDWFYVAMADVTLAQNDTSGDFDLFQGGDRALDVDASSYGRLAFFVNGRFGTQWKLSASADTREAPLDELFSNFASKSPDALFRRIDPDYHYPTFGDSSTVSELAPTQGRFFVRLDRGENFGQWGDFNLGYNNNELAQVDRGLYGGMFHFESPTTTSFGENRFALDTFAAEPGTIASREEFRGTGGSLYFLRRQDLTQGSERVRVEIRDKASGIVTGVVNLRPSLDYDIDYLQGRILLSEPLSSNVDDGLLVRGNSLNGDEAWLVVRYEYSPGFDELDALSVGGQLHYWVGDHVKLGLTANSNEQGDVDSELNAADITYRHSAQTWVKLQSGSSEGFLTSVRHSQDGGFGFSGLDDLAFATADAAANRADVSVGLNDFFAVRRGQIHLYSQEVDAGYAAPGLQTLTDTRNYGGSFRMSVIEGVSVGLKADRRVQELGVETDARELDVGWDINDFWSLNSGVREEMRRDSSLLVPATQIEGERRDAIVQLGYDSHRKWSTWGFVQETMSTTGTVEENARVGVGSNYRITEQLSVDLEVSDGDLGRGGRVGTNYIHNERTSLYMNYALENERTDNGLRAGRGSEGRFVAGARTRFSDSTSVFLEERRQSNDLVSGLTHSTGITYAPTERLNFSANTDIGTLQDQLTGAETERRAAGIQMGYGFDAVQFSSGIEYRVDDIEAIDASRSERKTWLLRNNFKYQLTPAFRLLGKLNHSESDSTEGSFYAGEYTEAVIGTGYRPVTNDRLNLMAKYTYFYNLPTSEQVTLRNTAAEYVQKSRIASVDISYDIRERWSIGGKYAYRVSQASLDRENPQFFDNGAQLMILRADWEFREGWEALIETRVLDMTDIGDRRSGALLVVSRYMGPHVKLGVGYNFTNFSDDLTDLQYDHRGVFLTMTGAL